MYLSYAFFVIAVFFITASHQNCPESYDVCRNCNFQQRPDEQVKLEDQYGAEIEVLKTYISGGYNCVEGNIRGIYKNDNRYPIFCNNRISLYTALGYCGHEFKTGGTYIVTFDHDGRKFFCNKRNFAKLKNLCSPTEYEIFCRR